MPLRKRSEFSTVPSEVADLNTANEAHAAELAASRCAVGNGTIPVKNGDISKVAFSGSFRGSFSAVSTTIFALIQQFSEFFRSALLC